MDLPVVPQRDGFPLEHGAEYRVLATVPGVSLPTAEEIAASFVRAGWAGLLLIWMPGMKVPNDFPPPSEVPSWGPLDVLIRAQGVWNGPTGPIATWPLKDDGVSSVHLHAVWRHDDTIPTPPPVPPSPPSTQPTTPPGGTKPPKPQGGSTPRPGGTGPAIVPLGPTGGVVESMGWGFPIAVGLGSALVVYLLLGRR